MYINIYRNIINAQFKVFNTSEKYFKSSETSHFHIIYCNQNISKIKYFGNVNIIIILIFYCPFDNNNTKNCIGIVRIDLQNRTM